MKVYSKDEYVELATSVNKGMPISEANKILEEQRQVKAKGEENFWRTLTH